MTSTYFENANAQEFDLYGAVIMAGKKGVKSNQIKSRSVPNLSSISQTDNINRSKTI